MTTRTWRTTAFCIMVLLSSGCWDHQPPETIAFVHMIGIDHDSENPSQMSVTQMIAIPSALAAGGAGAGGKPEGTPFYLLSATGNSVEGAQLASIDHLSRIPKLEHMVALIVGEEFARSGIGHTISWALRHPQVRPGAWLLVSEKSAQMFLDAGPALDPLPGAAIIGLMAHADRVPSTFPVKIYEFAQTVLSPRKDGLAPLVRRMNPLVTRVPPGFQPRPFAGEGPLTGTEPLDTQIQLMGMAVFKGDRMVGKLTGDDASGISWIHGAAKGPVSLPHPVRQDLFITALAIRSSAKRRAELRDDKLVLSIEVSTSMDVWDADMLEPVAVGKNLTAIQKAVEDGIKKDIQQTIQTLQLLRADVFGFAEELYRRAPADWKRIAAVWDDLYEEATLDIKVDVFLRRSGLAR